MEFGYGTIIKDKNLINEEYEMHESSIVANVSLYYTYSLIEDFLKKIMEPIFFFIELPLTKMEEDELRTKNSDPYHKGVYYLDDIKLKDAMDILNEYKELLLNDGFVQYGFASHKTDDEIMVSRYNIVSIYSNKISNFEPLFNKMKFKKKERIFTAWDTFNSENAGERRLVQYDKKTIYSIVDDLKDKGIYRYEVKEDY